MALSIETFDNNRGGNALYKALTHPHAATAARGLVAALARAGPVAICDPGGAVEGFAEIFGLDGIEITGVYVPEAVRVGTAVLGRAARPATEIGSSGARAVFVAAFDAERMLAQLEPCLGAGIARFTLDRMRLPADRLTNPRRYLDPLNFVTNFAFFREAVGLSTRLITANYWAGYGAAAVRCRLTLFAGGGGILAEWEERLAGGVGAFVLDSREIRSRFGLPEFCGQLFLHIIGAAGHDVVKYALDIFGASGEEAASLSATHDANSWPAERYAGLPAPASGERVLLWIQNSHPATIPAGAITLHPMGEETGAAVAENLPPFASRAVDVGTILPGLAWPRQVEVRAGKHMVRPRYEILAEGRRRIAHVNVERGDLVADPALPRLAELFGKGYLLPAPILPRREWQSLVLPTPMAVAQAELPIAAVVYDPAGREIARHRFGRLPRDHAAALDLDRLAGIEGLGEGWGHVELIYDFSEGGAADGWLHALFRYRRRDSGHAAETSFGAHIYNTVLTYRGEPQSYNGPPPGLSTRLFLRLGEGAHDTLCHLIYPASRPWRPLSATEIVLYDGAGAEIARTALAIPCSGSLLWHYHALFPASARGRAGSGAYVIVRDATCRLFGYHGLLGRDGAFSLDHMFGF
ncbi:MAG TPA: hypothetical protein VJ770_19580 [Stellaceae bacterium]|nr:hypothetical protein [Stellaceae bacterium]